MIGVSAPSGLVPGSRSAAQLQAAALSFIQAPQDDPELNALARSALNNGIDMLNERNWQKILGQQDITLILDQADYDLNLDVRAPRLCALLDPMGNPSARIGYKSQRVFEDEHGCSVSPGHPSTYTLDYGNRTFVLDVRPTQSFIDSYAYARLRYHRRVPHFTDAGDALGLPAEFDSFLELHAGAYLALIRGHRAAGMLRQQSEMRLNRLRVDDGIQDTDWS